MSSLPEKPALSDAGDEELYPVPAAAAAGTLIDAERYQAWYRRSVENPDGFFLEQARRLDWTTFPTRAGDWSFDPVSIRWFEDGRLNVSANCLDRHLAERGEQVAIIWEADAPDQPARSLTYRELHGQVCRLANVLKEMGAAKGDRITIYLPMIPEAAIAMLACARIGAVHSIVFAGFSPEALAGRIDDCGSKIVITADEGRRGGRPVPLKANVDVALESTPGVGAMLVVRHTGGAVAMQAGRDHWWHERLEAAAPDCEPEPVAAEDPLFILYTSGSTGRPKGVVHTSGGYLLWANITFSYVFDYRPGEVHWTAADVGWVTGHTYIVYGPLSNGATSLMFEGVPTWPDVDRFWQVVARHRASVLYMAPTAIRSLMREGEEPVRRHDLSSLRLLGSVGEPINPEAWRWYHRVVGGGRLPIVDTWWQTETGGVMISPLPGATPLKPGSASYPFFGVQPVLVDEQGREIEGAASGNLVMRASWPGQARTIYGDHHRFVETYFSTYPGFYFTGDGARRDADGYWWITGRVDDVLNVSGHRLGTAEVESALVADQRVAEAAVVGFPHDIKGTGIYAYVTLKAEVDVSDTLAAELRQSIRTHIGPIATPDYIHLTPALPKTRSGKIMRRILRKIAENDFGNLGDTSTLADPSVVQTIIDSRLNR